MDDDLQQPTIDAWHDATRSGAAAQAELLARMLDEQGYADSTARRVGKILRGFGRRHQATAATPLQQATAADAAGFIRATTRRGAPPSPATMHLRRTTLRIAVTQMRTLGIEAADPTLGLRLPPRTPAGVRPLTTDELTLLRVTATGRTRRQGAAVATVALSEAGATTGEVARLTWDDVDLDAHTLTLPGVGRTSPRTVPVTRWGHRALTTHRRSSPHRRSPVVYRGSADPGSDTAQAAITTRLRKLLVAAGLDDPQLRPGSVRLCLPAEQLATDGRVDRAAHQLGLDSLDVTARLLDWDWNV